MKKIELPYPPVVFEVDVVKLERQGYQLKLDGSILSITSSSVWGEEVFTDDFRIHTEEWIGRKEARAAFEEAASVLNKALLIGALRQSMY